MPHDDHPPPPSPPLALHDLHFPTAHPTPGWTGFQRLLDREPLVSAEERRLLPMAPALTGLDPETEHTLVKRLTGVLDAVETLAARYDEDADLQRFFDLPPLIHECVLADRHPGRHVDHCRFDLGGARLDDVRVFEVGGDYPVSNLSGLLNGHWRRVEDMRWLTDKYPPARCESPGWMVSELLDLARQRGQDPADIRHIAILRSEDLASFSEIRLLDTQIRHHGRTPVHLTPERACDDRTPIGFLPHTTQPLISNPNRYAPLLRRIASGDLLVFNGIRGRMIAGNKLVSAALSDTRFHHLFTPEQLSDIRATIPWSRKLDDSATDDVFTRRADLVIKAPFDALGRSVFIGRDHTPTEWSHRVRQGVRNGWLVQQFAEPHYIPTPTGPLRRTWGAIFCGGRIAGYNGRLSTTLLDHLTTGGLHAVLGTRHHTPPT